MYVCIVGTHYSNVHKDTIIAINVPIFSVLSSFLAFKDDASKLLFYSLGEHAGQNHTVRGGHLYLHAATARLSHLARL